MAPRRSSLRVTNNDQNQAIAKVEMSTCFGLQQRKKLFCCSAVVTMRADGRTWHRTTKFRSHQTIRRIIPGLSSAPMVCNLAPATTPLQTHTVRPHLSSRYQRSRTSSRSGSLLFQTPSGLAFRPQTNSATCMGFSSRSDERHAHISQQCIHHRILIRRLE
jgi:hypothetical protein